MHLPRLPQGRSFNLSGHPGQFDAAVDPRGPANTDGPNSYWQELFDQMYEVGARSLPLMVLAAASTGVVLSLQTRESLVRFGAKSLLPVVIVLTILKESGPIITALVVCGRVGAGIGAQLGSMKVTEQIDAIEASAVNPFRLLEVARVLVCILMLPLLTINN